MTSYQARFWALRSSGTRGCSSTRPPPTPGLCLSREDDQARAVAGNAAGPRPQARPHRARPANQAGISRPPRRRAHWLRTSACR